MSQVSKLKHTIELGFNERIALAPCGCEAKRETLGDREIITVSACAHSLSALAEVVEGLKLLAKGKLNPSSPMYAICMKDDEWWEREGNCDKDQWLAQRLLAQLGEVAPKPNPRDSCHCLDEGGRIHFCDQ